MLALVFDGALRLERNYPAPSPQPGEALIQPALVGICNTDIEITRGYMGFQGIPGHEFVGHVVDSDDPAWAGQRVVGEINAVDPACPVTSHTEKSHHPQRTTLGIDRRNGAMAERFTLPNHCLHAVPDQLPDEAAVFVEPLAAALQILHQVHLRPDEHVAVVGDGKLGALIVQVLRLPGCAVTLFGHHPERWEVFRQQGITCRSSSDLPETRFDVVVDCTGQPGGLDTARRLVRPAGRLVLKSTFQGAADLNLSMVVVDEVTLIGSRCGPFAAALRLLAHGLIETRPLISARFGLEDGVAAFAAARGQMKVLLHVAA